LKRSKLALNGRFSGTLKPTGTQLVAFHLYDAIIRSDRDFDIVIYADPAFPGVAEWAGLDNTTLVPTAFSKWSRNRAQFWEQAVLPCAVRLRGCDLVHHPLGTAPRWALGTKTVLTIHDLNCYHNEDAFEPAFRNFLLATFIPALHRADHVVAISDFVLADVRATLGIKAEKSSRIYNGLRPRPPSAVSVTEARRDHPVIFGVNLWQPHKNLSRLLEAFGQVRPDFPGLELHLAGRPQAQFKQQAELSASLDAPGVKVTGYLQEDELFDAYAGATVFCYPSLTEGFGLPILEAMMVGTPVATSDASCLPEIAGGAAILFDPKDPADIARALRAALRETPAERAVRVALGKKVAARFTWRQAATEYIALFSRLLRPA
jgi:glycosyltransferase involved in cell wall biosynthesis